MAGHSPSKTGVDALLPGHPRLGARTKDEDARHKAGHDGVARQPGGATVASAWPERLSASATKPFFFISSMKLRR